MKRSTDTMLSTHIGSLPRPDDLVEMLRAKESGEPYDQQAFADRVREAVAEIVRKQVDFGLDIINDGEQGKPSFLTYVNERLGGFEPGGLKGSPWLGSREALSFPEFYAAVARAGGGPGKSIKMVCTSPITYTGQEQLRAEIANFKAALEGVAVAEAFIPAISPSNIEDWHENKFYKTDEEFLFAIAEAMREEYKAIVDAGFLLQIDDPRLASYYAMTANVSIEQCRAWAEIRVEALNHALRDIPRERIRFHTCYSVNIGPRIHDMELKDFIDIMLKIRAGAYSFEAANPRHEHEWRVWKDVALPEGSVIIPGVISHSTILVEHPELVAERIARFAGVVGRDKVIAGADCGFSTFATSHEIHPSIVWAKLASLAEGARLAAKELW